MANSEAAVVGRGVVSAAAVWRGEPLGHAVATTTAGLLVAGSNGAVGTAAHASCCGVVLGNEPGIDAGHTGCNGDVVGNDHKLWDLAGVGERPVGVLNVAGDYHVMLDGIDDTHWPLVRAGLLLALTVTLRWVVLGRMLAPFGRLLTVRLVPAGTSVGVAGGRGKTVVMSGSEELP